MPESEEPKLVLVESFDELRVGMAVWVRHECCGKLGGRYIIIAFREKSWVVDDTLKAFEMPNFKYAPSHVCKGCFYPADAVEERWGVKADFPVRSSVITCDEVNDRLVYAEVMDLREREEQVVRIPEKVR